MTTIIKTIVSVFTAVIMFIASLGGTGAKDKGTILGFADTVTEQKEICDFYVDDDGDFTVLQVSDTHFTTCTTKGELSLINSIASQIDEYKPDLVVITGDLIDDGDKGPYNKKYVLDTVCNLFEEHAQYWAYIPGNNDGKNYGTSADVTAYLAQSQYCLAADDKSVSGGAQYSIDLRNADEELIHSFIFLDTMDYDNEDPSHIYGYVHADQVEWCENEIASKKAENEDVTISVFLHENTPNFEKAAVSGEAYKADYAKVEKSGASYEIPKNQPLDDVFDAAGCIGLITMGHSHPASCRCSYYNSTYYHIAPKAIVASALITIHTGADNTRAMYDFVQLNSTATIFGC